MAADDKIHKPGRGRVFNSITETIGDTPLVRMARMPQAAQSRHVRVMHPGAMEGRRQLASIELRVVSRSRDRAHVDDPLDGVRLQQTDEVGYRPSRVTDRENDQRSHVSSQS